jgi:hypothetical protein
MLPYETIGMKRPTEICQAPSRTILKRIDPPDHPSHCLVQRASRAGTIRVFHKQVLASNTLQEDYIGLEEVDNGVEAHDLFFCFYHVGRCELHTSKIHDTLSKVAMTRV